MTLVFAVLLLTCVITAVYISVANSTPSFVLCAAALRQLCYVLLLQFAAATNTSPQLPFVFLLPLSLLTPLLLLLVLSCLHLLPLLPALLCDGSAVLVC